MHTLTIQTHKPKEILDITDQVNHVISLSSKPFALCHIFVLHTTAAITTADLDPGTDLDFLDALEAMMPHLNFRHPHDPSHTPDHIWSSIIGASLTVPVENGELVLGTWQRVVLVELDGPRERKIALYFN
jgi:secondary thiamine-phosphate synthase enzyme